MTGKFYEDLEAGQKIRHGRGRTITEMDNVLFCGLTLNDQPLHIDEAFAAETQFGQRIVNGIFTMGLVVGLSVTELSAGTLIANLGYNNVRHPRPVFHGDTITAETEVISKRLSKSRPEAGLVTLRQTGRNQAGEVVLELERTALFKRQPVSD
jgi:acyl dehydratase